MTDENLSYRESLKLCMEVLFETTKKRNTETSICTNFRLWADFQGLSENVGRVGAIVRQCVHVLDEERMAVEEAAERQHTEAQLFASTI